MNHAEVVEEDKRKKLPSNWEAKRRRVEWEEEESQKRKVRNSSISILSALLWFGCVYSLKECADAGEDYDRIKLLEVGADEAEKFEKKKKKKNPDTGFAGNGVL